MGYFNPQPKNQSTPSSSSSSSSSSTANCQISTNDSSSETVIVVSQQQQQQGIKERVNQTAQIRRFTFFAFILIGCIQLMVANVFLYGVGPLCNKVFGIDDQTVTVRAVHSTILTIIIVFFIFFNAVKRCTIFFGLFLSLILILALGLSAEFASASISSALLHTLGAVAGVADAFVGTAAFGFAAQFPYNYSGAVSAGFGFAGVLTFGLWILGSLILFDNQTSRGTKSLIWLLCVAVLFLSTMTIICTIFLFKRKKSKNERKQLITSEEGTYEKEGLVSVLKHAAPVAGLLFLVLFTTLLLFPTFGPIAWYEAKINAYKSSTNSASYPRSFDIERDVLIGIYQLFSLFGLYLPVIIPFLKLETKNAAIVCFLRLLFIPLFIIPVIYVNSFLSQFWFLIIQQILLTFTNGWMFTICFIRVSESVTGNEATSRVASFSLLCVCSGMVAGQWGGHGIRKVVRLLTKQ